MFFYPKQWIKNPTCQKFDLKITVISSMSTAPSKLGHSMLFIHLSGTAGLVQSLAMHLPTWSHWSGKYGCVLHSGLCYKCYAKSKNKNKEILLKFCSFSLTKFQKNLKFVGYPTANKPY